MNNVDATVERDAYGNLYGAHDPVTLEDMYTSCEYCTRPDCGDCDTYIFEGVPC